MTVEYNPTVVRICEEARTTESDGDRFQIRIMNVEDTTGRCKTMEFNGDERIDNKQ